MGLALVGFAKGGGLWLQRQWAEEREATAREEGRASQAAEAAVEKATELREKGRWSEAQLALEGAQSLVGTSAPKHVLVRLQRAQADARMVSELDEIRLRSSEGRKNELTGPGSASAMYADAFRNYGIPLLTMKPPEAAARIRESSIRATLVAYLYHWILVPDADQVRLREVLDLADDDKWRSEFRRALVEDDANKLQALAHSPVALDQPPVVESALASAMIGKMYKYEAQVFMRDAQRRHPEDFWLNYLLGCFWWEEYPQEAVGYFRSAVAIRPKSPGAWSMLASALRGVGDEEGAIASFRRSIDLDPNDEVAKQFAWTMAASRSLEEARVAWEKFLKRDPPDHEAWRGYAALCLFLGHEEAYRKARGALLSRFGGTTSGWLVAERTSVECLLLPDSSDDLRRAIRLAEFAFAGEKPGERANPYLQFVKGLALYRDGRPEEAIAFLQTAAETLHDRAGPGLALAMAWFRSGKTAEARRSLAAAVRAYDWKAARLPAHADQSTLWVSHVLRREAEAMILPNLRLFLQGDYQPQDNDERIALLGICQAQDLTASAARLFATAFAADPELADRMMNDRSRHALDALRSNDDPNPVFNAACRYLAACCAASAGCGLGKDAATLSEPERARLRNQAREWLQAT
jgi:serine/threonine-protein kinase